MKFHLKPRKPLPVSEPEFSIPSILSAAPGLSVCITSLNDNAELQPTINSIRETAGDAVEIVVVDDHSEVPPSVTGADIFIRNPSRAGVARSRDIAAAAATKEYILLTDAHMRFDPQWWASLRQRIGDPKQAWCGQCVGLHEDDMDMSIPHGKYHGARMVFIENERTKSPVIFEGKWAKEWKDKDDYEISCFMGASYVINREFYFEVGGLAALKHWGSDEPYLSTKIYLGGGSIRLCKTVQIGHMFRKRAPYRSNPWCILYNKLRGLMELLPEDDYTWMLGKFQKTNHLSLAAQQLMKDLPLVREAQKRNGQVFTRDIGWFCDRFNLNNPCHLRSSHPILRE